MKKRVKLTESELTRLIKNIILEGEREHKRELELKDRLDDIFFGPDKNNLFSDSGELQNAVKKALGSGQVVQAVPTERIASLGVNPNFSYSVINFTGKGL